jgi:cathepsin F
VDFQGDLPESWDWVQHGAVTPVKDQGSVGSCWAFSTTGNIEGQVFMATKTLTALSEEYLVDCDDKDCSVFGGWPYLAYQYIMESGGIPTESSYPYCAGVGTCFPCEDKVAFVPARRRPCDGCARIPSRQAC